MNPTEHTMLGVLFILVTLSVGIGIMNNCLNYDILDELKKLNSKDGGK